MTVTAQTGDRYVDVPGGRLRLRDEGAGRPILLVHAGIARLESWDGVAERLVDAGFRALRHDMRSWGESTTDDVAFSHPADIVAVLDAAEIDRAVLVGNSMGGVHSFSTAIEYPTRVAAVVGVGAGLAGYEPDVPADEAELFAEMERLDEADPPDADAIADIDVRGWVDGPGQGPDRVPAWIRDTIRDVGPRAQPRPTGSSAGRSGWTRRLPSVSPSSPARCSRSPARSTSPRSLRPPGIWPRTRLGPGRSSGTTSRT